MTLGASYHDAVEFGIVLLVGIVLGGMYIALFLIRCTTKNRVLRFIYDLTYAIIVGGVFLMVQKRLNGIDIKYYHILALMIGIAGAGVAPTLYLERYTTRIEARVKALKVRVHESRLYHIIKK